MFFVTRKKMSAKILNIFKIFILLYFVAGIPVLGNGNKVFVAGKSPLFNSANDTIKKLSAVSNNNPNDTILVKKKVKNKILSKEGIVVKQFGLNFDKSISKDSSSDKSNTNIETTINNNKKDNTTDKPSISLIENVLRNKNLSEAPPVNLFSQLSDKKHTSKLEFLNTVKQLNKLQKEIYKKNAEKKKTSPVKWLILLIAAILIIVVLAFFIEEYLTLFLIGFMLVALVLLIGFL